MDKPRTYVFDAAPVYLRVLDIMKETIPNATQFSSNPDLLNPIIRVILHSVFIREVVVSWKWGSSGNDELTTRNIRTNLRRNYIGVEDGPYLLFLERMSADPKLKNIVKKLLPFTPVDTRFQLDPINKSIWVIITGISL